MGTEIYTTKEMSENVFSRELNPGLLVTSQMLGSDYRLNTFSLISFVVPISVPITITEHQTKWPNGKMVGHQTIFDVV